MSAPVSYTSLIREFLAGRLAQGQPFTTRAQIIDALSVLPEEWPRAYSAIRKLKRRGELLTEGQGFRYLPEQAPAEPMSDRIYRVVRAQKGSFTSAHISTLAEVNIERVRNIIDALAAAGYLQEAGRYEKAKVWLATPLCRNTPKPPNINRPGHGGFGLERLAVARLVDIFLNSADLSGSRLADSIREQLNILNRRFGVKGEKGDNQKN